MQTNRLLKRDRHHVDCYYWTDTWYALRVKLSALLTLTGPDFFVNFLSHYVQYRPHKRPLVGVMARVKICR